MATLTLRRIECDDDDLPDLCMRCGEPATNTKKKTFNWSPPWLIVIVLISLLIGLILMLILQKRMTVHIPLCDRHRRNWRRRTIAMIVALVVTFGSIVAGIVVGTQLPPGPNKVGGPLVAVGVLGIFGCIFLALIFQQITIRAKEITDGDITLAGVSDDFIDAVKDGRRARRKNDYGNDDDDAPGQAYEEKLRQRRQRRVRDEDDD